jgi:hypothetical protein
MRRRVCKTAPLESWVHRIDVRGLFGGRWQAWWALSAFSLAHFWVPLSYSFLDLSRCQSVYTTNRPHVSLSRRARLNLSQTSMQMQGCGRVIAPSRHRGILLPVAAMH